jgi:hypothetical protein
VPSASQQRQHHRPFSLLDSQVGKNSTVGCIVNPSDSTGKSMGFAPLMILST